MEIKHGRAAMLGFLHVIAVEAGAKIPTEECLAAPTGLIASLESMPTFAWLQIMLFCCMQETGAGNESSFFALAKPQTVDAEAGDIAGIGWVRYDDPETKTFKLNAERQNGRRRCSASPAASSTSSSASTALPDLRHGRRCPAHHLLSV